MAKLYYSVNKIVDCVQMSNMIGGLPFIPGRTRLGETAVGSDRYYPSSH